MKKLLALFLAISMTFSLIIMPVSAADKLTVSLDQAEVEAGKEVKVNLNVSNNPGLTALTVRVFYKKDELTCTGISTQKQSDNNFTAWKQFEKELATLEEEEEQGRKVSVEFNKNDTSAANLSEERKNAGWALANFAYIVSKTVFDKNGVVACLTFKAAEGLESGTTPIEIEIVKASGEKNVTLETASLNSSLTINGVAPTLGKVTVTDKDNNTVLDTSNSELKFGTLEVNGTTDYTYQAHAWSTSGKEITGNVTWKFKVGRELCTEFRGATIDETTGQIFIPKDASTDVSGTTFAMSVVAQAKEGVTAEKDIETSLIQVRRERYRIAAIQISRKEGETGELIIPGKDEAPATAEFVATCTNQYGRPYEGDQTVYWNYERVGSQYGVKTVGFINTTATGATLKAEAGAADSVTDSATLKVKVYAGDINDRVYSNEVEITVRRDTVQRPAKIEISGAGTIAVPTTGEKKETYTATVYNQYGTEITNPGTIEWKLYDEYGREHPLKGVSIEGGVVTVTKEAAKNSFNDDGMRNIRVRAYCGEVYGESGAVHLTREKARATRIAMEDITIAVPKSGEANVTRSYLEVYDQYDIKMGSPTIERKMTSSTPAGVTFSGDKITVTSAAAGNTFNNGKLEISVTITCNSASTDIVSETKTITLTRQQSVATSFYWDDDGINNRQAVPHRAGEKVPASVKVIVRDQYGQRMTDAEVQSNGALPTGIILENGKLYITKDAVDHFNGVRGDSTKGIRVSLKSGNAQVIVTVYLKLADAQTNPQSAEISGQNKIARPTDDTPNTAEYTISDVIRDQYGLPMEINRSNLSLKLYHDKECGSEANGSRDPVQLSGPDQSGKWTITVTKDATLDKTYYLMAKYNDQQCSDATPITITNKQEGAPLTVVQGDITYGETVSPSVSNTPAGAGDITYTYVGRDGTTYNSSDAPTNAGKYTVTATCEDATHIYTGSADFQILPKKILVDWIELTNDEYTYNGREQTVKYTVKDGKTTLVKDRDYTVEGDKQTNAGVHLLKIIGKGNYTSDPTGAPSVNWDIWELPVRINTATFQPRAYAKENYSAELDALTLVAAEDGVTMPDTLTAGDDFTVSDIRVTNNNAGQQPVSFKVTLTNTNYKWKNETGNIFNVSESAGYKVTISKIDHRAETAAAAGKYGNQLSVDLSQVLPEGWSATASSIDNTNAVLTEIHGGAMYIMEQDGKLWLQLTNDSNKVGKDATVTLTVNSTNYNPFTITVTVTVQTKAQQVITASDLNVTYGDAGVKLNASALDNAELAYEVTEGADVVAVDANGNVTLRKSGTAKIKITAAETEDYGTANTTVTVTVAKRSLTVKANDLTAYVGGQLPALDYTVTGLVSGDTLTVEPVLELKDVPAGVEPMKTAGTYTIGFKTAPVADKDKYDLTVETGTLTVSSRPNVNPVPAGNSVKLEEAAGGKLTSSVSRATKGTTVTITVKPDAGYQLEELEVLDKNGEALPLKELANGKFSFQMPDSKVTVQASFVQESTYAGYPDVLPQDWFYSSVRYVTERGLMNGTPNGFEPNMDSSRATIWTILARFSGVDTTVVSGEWYAVARQWAMENGVSDGTNPNGVITREQLATMLYRFAKNKGLVQEPVTADLSVFVDAGQISDYALDAMRWAVSVGLLNGMDGSRLAPQGSAARAQVAAMLMRFDQLAK